MPKFHVLIKPVGPLCNMACEYCFYLDKQSIIQPAKSNNGLMIASYIDENVMTSHTVDCYIQQVLDRPGTFQFEFAFQGGEPTLAGLDYYEYFFRQVDSLIKETQSISYTFQTNGLLIDDQWCELLKKHNVLVGLSIDGPPHLHHKYRKDKKGKSTSARVMKTLDLFKKHGIAFNTLTVINNENGKHPLEVYQFLKDSNVEHMQFIPLVERLEKNSGVVVPGLSNCHDGNQLIEPSWSIDSDVFGQFYTDIYDEWVQYDVGKVFVQMFELQLGFEMGLPSSVCLYSKTCGQAGVLEKNGDVYSCDHYVYPEFMLGNIHDTEMADMFESPFQTRFGQNKFDLLPQYCLDCEFLIRCYGGCPKHRWGKTEAGESGLNILCEGYKYFFNHIKPTMAFMGDCLKHQVSPALVMAHLPGKKIKRNHPCPCGSGKKYKQCCIES